MTNESVLEELYDDLKPILIKSDGSLIPHPEVELRRDDLTKIAARFMEEYAADSLDEVFNAYNMTVVHVLEDAGIIRKGKLQ